MVEQAGQIRLIHDSRDNDVGMKSRCWHPGHRPGGGSTSVPKGMRVLQCGHTYTGRWSGMWRAYQKMNPASTDSSLKFRGHLVRWEQS